VKIQETRLKTQEASKDLQVGGILLFEDEDLKMTENRRLGSEERHNAPKAFAMRLGHEN
jgi:hypothetical protein